MNINNDPFHNQIKTGTINQLKGTKMSQVDPWGVNINEISILAIVIYWLCKNQIDKMTVRCLKDNLLTNFIMEIAQ